MTTKNKPMTSLKSDAEAERFVSTADLSKFDLSGFKPMRFKIEPKSAVLHSRLPEALLEGLKGRAKARGVPYTRCVRMLLENDLAKSSG